jgi:hypothetical protein
MFGAIQYASGNDLRGTLTDQDQGVSNTVAANTVNRAAKADRASLNNASSDQQSQTLSFRVHGVSDTSILVRLAGTVTPTKTETAKNSVAPVVGKQQRAAVACEPPVSVLTDVAKLLQPGRCVT